MMGLLVPVVTASLLGSLHCAGMCGGLVAFATGGTRGGFRAQVLPHAAYHLARGLGYVTIGGVAGFVGATIDGLGTRAGVSRTAGVIAGLVMLLWGGAKLLQAGGVKLRDLGLGGRFEERLAGLVRAARARPPMFRASLTGACTAALPCGLLHAFTIVAAGTGSFAGGTSVMAAFWLGTVPALVGLGAGVQAITSRLRRHAALVSALGLVAVGLTSIAGHLSISLPPQPHAGAPRENPWVCHGN